DQRRELPAAAGRGDAPVRLGQGQGRRRRGALSRARRGADEAARADRDRRGSTLRDAHPRQARAVKKKPQPILLGTDAMHHTMNWLTTLQLNNRRPQSKEPVMRLIFRTVSVLFAVYLAASASSEEKKVNPIEKEVKASLKDPSKPFVMFVRL